MTRRRAVISALIESVLLAGAGGYVIYADIHSGLYVLRYTGPHKREVPNVGDCLSGNPGASTPRYEPCAPYGRWSDPRNDWTRAGVAAPPGEDEH